MSTVHICLTDIFGVAVACEVIFYPGDTPFFNGSAVAISGACSIRLDADGNGSVTLLPGRYAVRFSEITSNTDTLLILVPNDEATYELPALVTAGNWILPFRDFLQGAKNLADVADAATAFATIKQAATAAASGVVQLATQAEVDAGTDVTKAVTPATLAARLADISSGAVATSYEAKSAAFTAMAGGQYALDTTAGGFDVTIDATLPVGKYIDFADAFGTWNANPPTFLRNGHLMEGAAVDYADATHGTSLRILNVGGTIGLRVLEVTPTQIGAATSAQGAKADSALQSLPAATQSAVDSGTDTTTAVTPETFAVSLVLRPGGGSTKMATMLPRWTAAKANVRSGTRNAIIACVGDSVTQGYDAITGMTKSYPRQLSYMLDKAGLPTGEEFFFTFSGAETDPRVTRSPGVRNVLREVYNGSFQNIYTNTASLTIQPTRQYDTVDVYYLCSGELGTVVATVNGTAIITAQNVAPGFSNGQTPLVKVTGTCALGLSPVVITAPQAVNNGANIAGVVTRKAGDYGKNVTVLNCGYGGLRAAAWSHNSDPWWTACGDDFLPAVPVDLLIYNMMGNDAAVGADVATYKATAKSYIQYALQYMDVLMVAPHTQNPSVVANYAPYRQAYTEVAAELGVPLLNIYERWGTWAQGDALGYFGPTHDPAHPDATGYADIAQAICDVIK